jgi:ubiquinone/menaquinone biosynthesis C-methylase UbiE
MSTATVKAYRGMGMEGPVARWYAASTLKSLDEFRKLAREAAADLPPGSRVLEVAPGPGYFAIELAKLGRYSITGLDISKTCVEIASRNAREAGVDVAFKRGDAAAMPFADESFDFILCRAAFKNFTQPVTALQEMRRVLTPGGRGVLIDLRKDASRDDIRRMVDSMGLSFAGRLMTQFTFRFMLLKRAYTEAQFRDFFGLANFQSLDLQKNAVGFEIHFRR